MEFMRWISSGSFTEWRDYDIGWIVVTVVLSTLVASGYAVIMFNWYFQLRMNKKEQARTSLRRLGLIVALCTACGLFFAASDTSWLAWRFYDAILLVLAIHTWHFAVKSRGLSFVDERLAEVSELEQTCARYMEIAELLPQMVWTATGAGEIDYFNHRWVEYVRDGRNWLDATHPSERQAVCRWWAETVAGRYVSKREIRLQGASGYRTFLVTATPIVKGNSVKWLGACADIEYQKLFAAEKEKQAQQRLFFLNSLSHDLRAPLNNVVLNAQLLGMISKDEEISENVAIIVENALAASGLISQLLEYARSGPEPRNELARVSLQATLGNVERRFSPVVAKKNIFLNVVVETDFVVETDKVKLERVIANLVDNAIKYTTDGGVTVSLEEGGGELIILVSDTGSGIPESHVGRLFEEFYQVNNHERDCRKGFGLGLAICKQLARQIGGDVRLIQTSPQGSKFGLFVPVSDFDSGGQPNYTPCNGIDIKTERVCVG